jgi:hypothetical protein
MTQIQWQKLVARLHDAKNAVSVDFSVDGLVLTADLVRSELNRESAKRMILTLAAKVLTITGGDDRVDRIGTMERYRFDHQSSGRAAVAALTTFGPLGTPIDTTEPHDFIMRVSFRSATEEALARRDVGDWRNTIIQVWNRESEEREPNPRQLDVSIDYQTYFVPERQYRATLVEEHAPVINAALTAARVRGRVIACPCV